KLPPYISKVRLFLLKYLIVLNQMISPGSFRRIMDLKRVHDLKMKLLQHGLMLKISGIFSKEELKKYQIQTAVLLKQENSGLYLFLNFWATTFHYTKQKK